MYMYISIYQERKRQKYFKHPEKYRNYFDNICVTYSIQS